MAQHSGEEWHSSDGTQGYMYRTSEAPHFVYTQHTSLHAHHPDCHTTATMNIHVHQFLLSIYKDNLKSNLF